MPVVDDADARAKRLHFFDVMADVENRCAGVMEPANFLEQMGPRLRIDADGRLVEQHELWLMHRAAPEFSRRFMPPENVATADRPARRARSLQATDRRAGAARARKIVQTAEKCRDFAAGQFAYRANSCGTIPNCRRTPDRSDSPTGRECEPRRPSAPAGKPGWKRACFCRRHSVRASRISLPRRPGTDAVGLWCAVALSEDRRLRPTGQSLRRSPGFGCETLGEHPTTSTAARPVHYPFLQLTSITSGSLLICSTIASKA